MYLWYNNMKIIKHILLKIFCKTAFIQCCTTLGPPKDVSKHYHWIVQRATNRKMPYIDLLQKYIFVNK